MTSLTACGVLSPHNVKPAIRHGQDVKLAVRCNRPAGHDGNHCWSDGRRARVAEWTVKGEVVR